ncbi:MAG: EamA/RhaT family transporter [Thermoprotei archaeon]|nr:MAG: EamA/RhaT family transporter [Thermoprotei archaeon]RLF22314.1 MAG: EamA/RhaT family transporter [Thermoprotei archaeon]
MLRPIVSCMLMFIAALSISFASIFVLLSGASAVACAFWRLILSTGILYAYSRVTGSRIVLRDMRSCIFSIASGIALGMHFALWMNSLFRVPVVVSTTVVVTYPIHTLVFEKVFLGERINTVRALGMSIAFVGILLYFYDSLITATLDFIGVLESFTASVLSAAYFYMGRIVRRNTDVYGYVVPAYSMGSLTVLLYAIFINDNVIQYLPSSWPWFVALAIVPMIGGHTVMNYLLRFYRSSTVTSIAFTEPLGATMLAYLILGQVPNIRHLVIAPIVLLGTVMAMASDIFEGS